MSETLKPCPFCGGEAYITKWHSKTGTSIKCKFCGCTTQIRKWLKNRNRIME